VIFHTPLNHQTFVDREYEEGNLRQVEMKAEPNYIDGRLDQGVRNRMNMFSKEGREIPDSTHTIIPPLIRPTHFAYTPYTQNTYWISHPPADSSLAPEKSEEFKTSFLATPFTSFDHERRARHIQSKYDALRANDAAFHERVNAMNTAWQVGRERTLQNIRDQEAAYQKALAIRNRIENPYRFG
jgi:hypothetical protein